MGAASGWAAEPWRCNLAGIGEPAGVSGDSKKNDWQKSEGADLRVGAVSAETQLYFMMLGIRVLQVYGLTETTAICTMDDPNRVEVGRVGRRFRGWR